MQRIVNPSKVNYRKNKNKVKKEDGNEYHWICDMDITRKDITISETKLTNVYTCF